MLLFRYTPEEDRQLSKQEEAEMHTQWGTFIGNIAIAEKLVSTHQLGFESMQILPDMQEKEGMNANEKQLVGGNMIVKANSLKEASELAKACPILKMGGTVEVRNVLPME